MQLTTGSKEQETYKQLFHKRFQSPTILTGLQRVSDAFQEIRQVFLTLTRTSLTQCMSCCQKKVPRRPKES
jgi:hypothetical protein